MSRAERNVNLIGVVVPFLGLIAAVVLLWNQWVDWIDLTIMAVTYVAFGLGITVGYHRLLTHRSFRTHKPTEYTFADPRLDGPPGLGDGLGGRPPQAPRARRRGGRPALPARRPRLRPGRALARPHRLADGDPRPGRLEEVRRRALRGPGHAPDRPDVPVAGARLASGSRRCSAGRCTASRSRARCAASSGAASCARSSCTTSRGRSTRSATSSAAAGSRSRTSRPTSPGWRSPRWARPGTTTTTPSRARPSTASSAGRSIRPRSSSGRWRRSGWPGTSCGSRPSARRRSWSAPSSRPQPAPVEQREPAGVS